MNSIRDDLQHRSGAPGKRHDPEPEGRRTRPASEWKRAMNPTRKSAAEVVLRGVTKRYGAVTAVKPVDLHIARETWSLFSARPGCGKTTLLRMVAGLERVSEGQILIGGRDVTDLSAGERNVSMVFQSYALFPHMSVRDNVAYGLISSGVSKREAHDRGRGGAGDGGPDGFRRPPALRDVRRSAAAGRGRPGARPQARRAAVRRAAVQPRRAVAPIDARGDPRRSSNVSA